MLTFTNYEIDLRSIPGEICLTFYICDCPCHCQGCSSPWLWQPGQYTLTETTIDKAIAKYPYATCILLMGGDNDYDSVKRLGDYIQSKNVLAGFYSGCPYSLDIAPHVNYYKVGKWWPDLGPLNSPTTNQRLYRIERKSENALPLYHPVDITYKFWTKQNEWKPQKEKEIEQNRTEWYKTLGADNHEN